MNWPRVPIQRLARLGTGHTPSRSHPEYWENCTIPWFTLADVGQLRHDAVTTVYETKENISEVGLANSAAELHPAGTVVLSRTASVGFSAILGQPMATSQDFATWTCGPRLNPRFLLAALRGLRQEILGLRMGSTHQTIYMPDIARLSIPLPPPGKQAEIADYLDVETARIDALIAMKRGLVDLLMARRSATIEKAIRDLTGLHPPMPLKRAAPEVQVGIVITPAVWYADDGVLALRGVNVRPGRLVLEDVVRISEEGHRLHRKSELRSGDVVVVRTGQSGAAVVVPPSLDGSNCIDLVIIRRSSRLLSKFLEFVLNSDWTQKHIEAYSVGTIQSHFNVGAMKELPLPVPPLALQGEIAERLAGDGAQLDGLIAKLQTQVALLVEHRQALITAAVTGELSIPGAAA